MKMNAFLRLIRSIACGVVVLGAADGVVGQVNDTVAISGTLQSVDDSVSGGQAHTAGQVQKSMTNDTLGASPAQVYYPPGMEIPLTETEIPGSSYFVGPDGERIDAPTMLNQVPAGQAFGTQGQDSLQGLSSGQSFSPEGVYDGTLSFPMGTFPTTPFGERILSEVPAGDPKVDDSKSSEIEGALVDNIGSPKDIVAGKGSTSKMENGVPIDQVVRPDSSPVTGELNVADDQRSVATEQLAKHHDRIKQRLKETLGENEQLTATLRRVNQKMERLTKQFSELKAAESKMQDDSRANSAKKVKGLEKSLAQAQRRHKEKVKAMQSAAKQEQTKMKALLSDKEEAMKEAKVAQKALAETKAKMTAKLADAKAATAQAEQKVAGAMAKLKMAKAENIVLTENIALAEKVVAGATAGMAAKGGEMSKGSDKDAAATAADAAAKAKAAAEIEVKRRLEKAKQAKKAAQDAEDAAVKKKRRKADGDDVLSLDDQIKRLKAKRDQQIADSETRIRAKQQKEIDKLLEQGKAIDSDEVKAAVDKMKGAIKTSEEKLRARFLRRLERLKQDMKDSLK